MDPKRNKVSSSPQGRGDKSPVPADIIAFLEGPLSAWFRERNHAIHGMAKLRSADDDESFAERYNDLRRLAVQGVHVLLRLDELDRREKQRNNAGRSATEPDALALLPQIQRLLAQAGGDAS